MLGQEDSLEEGPAILQHSCQENPMDMGAWWTIVYRVTKSLTQLNWLSTHARAHTHIYIYITSYLFVLMLEIFWWLPLQENYNQNSFLCSIGPTWCDLTCVPILIFCHAALRSPRFSHTAHSDALQTLQVCFLSILYLCSFYLNPLLLAILSQLKHHILRVAFSNHPDQLLSTPSSYMLQSHQI